MGPDGNVIIEWKGLVALAREHFINLVRTTIVSNKAALKEVLAAQHLKISNAAREVMEQPINLQELS